MNTAAQTAPKPLSEIVAGDVVKHYDRDAKVLAVHVLSATMTEIAFEDSFTIGGPSDCLPVYL